MAYLNEKEVARSINLTDSFPSYNSALCSDREAGFPENNLMVYVSNGEIVIRCKYPEFIEKTIEIFNILRFKSSETSLHCKYINRVVFAPNSLFLVVRFNYNEKPLSFKLTYK